MLRATRFAFRHTRGAAHGEFNHMSHSLSIFDNLPRKRSAHLLQRRRERRRSIGVRQRNSARPARQQQHRIVWSMCLRRSRCS